MRAARNFLLDNSASLVKYFPTRKFGIPPQEDTPEIDLGCVA